MNKRKSTYTDIKQRKRENGKKQDKQQKEKKKERKLLSVQQFKDSRLDHPLLFRYGRQYTGEVQIDQHKTCLLVSGKNASGALGRAWERVVSLGAVRSLLNASF